MADNRPRGRQKNITGHGKPIQRRGSGLGTGPVGRRPSGGGSSDRNVTRSNGGGMSKIIVALLVLLLGGGGGIGSLLLGGDTTTSTPTIPPPSQSTVNSQSIDLSSYWGNLGGGNVSSGWDNGTNTGTLDTSVIDGAREKLQPNHLH